MMKKKGGKRRTDRVWKGRKDEYLERQIIRKWKWEIQERKNERSSGWGK